MLALGPKLNKEEEVDVFADHADPNQFWYLPGPVSLARRTEDGEPAFTLIKYKPAAVAGGAKGGGFLMFEVHLQLDPDLERKILAQMGKFAPSAPKLSPVPFDEGTVQCIALNLQGGGGAAAPPEAFNAVEKILGASIPSLSGDNRAAFSLTLSQEGAIILEQAFQQEAAPVGVLYQLKYSILRPALDVKITADMKRVFDHFGASISGQFYFVKVGIQAALEKLKQEGVIKIEVKNFSTAQDRQNKEQWALDFFMNKLVQDWFRPTLGPLDTSRPGTPTSPGTPGSPTGPGVPTGPGSPVGGPGSPTGSPMPTGGPATPTGGPGAPVSPTGPGNPAGSPTTPTNPGTPTGSPGTPTGTPGSPGTPVTPTGGPGTPTGTPATPSGGPGAPGSPTGPGVPAGGPGTPASPSGSAIPGAGLATALGTLATAAGAPATLTGPGSPAAAGVAPSPLPTPPGTPAVPTTPTVPAIPRPGSTPTAPAGGTAGSPAISLELKYVHQEELKTVTFEYSSSEAVQRTYAPQGFFTLLLSELDRKKHFIDVDLDDPFFRAFAVELDAPFDFSKIGLNSIHVSLDYGKADGSENHKHGDFVFDKDNQGPRKFEVFMNQSRDLAYTYQVQYHFDPNSGWLGEKFSYELPAKLTEDRTLLLNPWEHLGFLEAKIFPHRMDPGILESTEVFLEYQDPGGWNQRSSFIVTPDSQPQFWKVRLSDPTARSYTYRFVHHLKDGSIRESQALATQASAIAVDDPFRDALELLFFPALDASQTKMVFVDVEYHDADNNYHREERLKILGNATNEVSLRIAQLNPNKKMFKYQFTFIGANGQIRRAPPVETEESFISVAG
jgi:hypothetical protein